MSKAKEPNFIAIPIAIKRSWLIAILFAIWLILAKVFQGKATLVLAVPDETDVTTWAGNVADSIRGNRSDGASFKYFFNPVREFIDGFVTGIREIIAIPTGNSSIPMLGWLGVIAVIGFVVYAVSHLRMAAAAGSIAQ